MEIIKQMTQKKKYILMTAVLVFLAVLFSVITVIQSQKLVGKKHPGFLAFDNGLVFGLVDETWSGARSGLRMYDTIVGVDGKSYESVSALFDYINQSQNQKIVQYDVIRHNQKIHINISPIIVTQNFAFIYFYIFLFCGLLTLLTGLSVFMIRPLAKGAFHFFLICQTIGLFEILSADMMAYQRFMPILQLVIAFYALINVHTLYYLLKMRGGSFKEKLTKKSVKWGLNVVSVGVMLFALWVYRASLDSFLNFKLLLFFGNFLFFLAGVLIYVFSTYMYLTAKSSTAKRRLLIYMAFNVSCFISFVVYVAHNVCAFLMPIEVILLQLAFPFVTTYVLFRHNFLDLKFAPKRKYFYIGFAVFLPMLFLADFIFLNPVLAKYNFSTVFITGVLACVIALKVGVLVWAAYHRIVDRLFFPSTYRFKKMVTQVSHGLLNQHTKEEITNSLRKIISDHLEVNNVYCYYENDILDSYQKQKVLMTSENLDETYLSLQESYAKDKLLIEKTDYLINEFVANHKIEHPGMALLVEHDLNLLLPIKLNDNILGFVLIGPKPDYVPFTTEDLTNLQTLLSTTAVALLNAKHHSALLLLQKQLETENKRLREEIQNGQNLPKVIGENKGLKPVMKRIDMIGNSAISVLLHGETGSGKEIVAHAIHGRSLRSEQSFVKVNCAAIPENLFESELFGYEKGAFTGANEQKRGFFEVADQGTLFLDEIGEIPLNVQPKLLRALQEKEIVRVGGTRPVSVDVRIIAATNRDLDHMVKEGRFRQDLYYRLNVLPVFIPPLRERLEDIEDFIALFIQKYSVEMKKHLLPPTAEDIKKLKMYPWPGNVRELQNVIERSVALSQDGQRITFFSLDNNAPIPQTKVDKIFEKGDFYEQMDALKKQVIKRAIKRADGNKSQAARDLGLHQVSLYKMVKQLGVE